MWPRPPKTPEESLKPGEVVVQFSKETAEATIDQFIEDHNLPAKPYRFFEGWPNCVVFLVPIGEESKWVERMRADKRCKSVGQNVFLRVPTFGNP